MTQQQQEQQQSLHPASPGKRALQGAGIALILIGLFLAGVERPDPTWHKLWFVKPLIIVPMAGALGGIFYYLMDNLRYKGGWSRAGANILSLVVYIIALWLGSVLGLNGTLWD